MSRRVPRRSRRGLARPVAKAGPGSLNRREGVTGARAELSEATLEDFFLHALLEAETGAEAGTAHG